ncbi:MAG: hypothetical protein DRI34_07500 [Deltaproteobacteria bacterium]|nr:MAG: hypothetical protein DRI34_07500 [Deltaproteobacteria bacterium]
MTSAIHAQDLRKATRGSGANYLAALLQVGIFVFHTVGARLFGKLAYGAYIFAWSVVELANKVAVAGLDKGILRAVASERARQDDRAELRALATALRVVLLASLAAVALIELGAGLIARWQEVPAYAPTLRALGPLTFLWSSTVVLVAATMGLRTMRYNLLVRGVADPALLIVSGLLWALCWRQGAGLAMALAHVCAASATFLLALLAFGRCFGLRRVAARMLRGRWDGSLVRFSIPVGLAELLNQAIYRVDVILIGAFMQDPLQVANYGACILLSNTISSVRYAFDPVLSPVVAETMVSGDLGRLQHNLRLMVRWVTLLAFPLFVVMLVFGRTLLGLWGESYASAHTALSLLASGHMINAVLGLHQWPVVMSGRSRLDLLNNAVAFAVNLGLNLLLIPRFGLVGAASATLAGNLVLRLLQAIEVGVIFHIHAFSGYWFKVLLSAAGLAAGALLPGGLGLGGPGALAVGLAVGLLLYGLAYRLLGPGPEERKLLGRLWRRLRGQGEE